MNENLTKQYEIQKEIRQGCPLSGAGTAKQEFQKRWQSKMTTN